EVTEPEAPAPEAGAAAPAAEAATTDEPGSVSGEAAAAPAAEPEPEPAIVDEERQPLLDLLAQHLGDGLVATHVVPGRDMTARVTREAWVRAAEVCRDVLGMRYFGFLSAMDWMPSPYGRSEDGGLAGAGVDEAFVAPDPAAFEPGTTGGETRFQLLARLEVPAAPSLGITLKCDVPADDLVMPSWIAVFPGADWHERECAEMFGIGFAGHPNLVKLYLPGAFEGFPLRKDFPLLARDVKPWPGLVDVEAMPGEEASTDDEESVTAGAEEG
nr:NADH-quinone oxidoreductase subunit C [Actinomycetota bacterium]